MSKKTIDTIVVDVPRKKTRAIELYAGGTPFKPKVVAPKNKYKRKEKHKNVEQY